MDKVISFSLGNVWYSLSIVGSLGTAFVFTYLPMFQLDDVAILTFTHLYGSSWDYSLCPD